jgi:UDP-N-acetylmuramyl pentapeptide phosphotransferase/UDP-N-acetylglucosamine-1-phosphate transferase
VFLGDSGSYLTGLFLAYVILDSGTGPTVDVLIGFAVLGVFLIDLAASVIRRSATGGPLFVGDRSHLYDQLRDRGQPVPMVSMMSGVAQLFLVLLIVGIDRTLPSPYALGVIGLVLLATLASLWRTGFLTARTD